MGVANAYEEVRGCLLLHKLHVTLLFVALSLVITVLQRLFQVGRLAAHLRARIGLSMHLQP